MKLEIPEDELEIHLEQDEEGRWICRAFHTPTGSLKISDWLWSRSEAVQQACTELAELVAERQKGLR